VPVGGVAWGIIVVFAAASESQQKTKGEKVKG